MYSATGGFDDMEQYPTIEEKAARLAFAIVGNHAFIDGNKRIGILCMLMTLQLNHSSIQFTQQELIHLGLSIADGSYGYEEIHFWIVSHKQ